ncbi:MAG TPA: YhdP family protein [Burkholderiales bacterium]|nr:YhdP family protein [Burkholderiales bacterium]
MFLKYCLAFLKHGSLWTYRAATAAVLAVGLAFVLLVLGLRYLALPNVNDYRDNIARAISGAIGQQVTIGSIAGSWQGYRPELTLMEVAVAGAGAQPAFAFHRVDAALSWLSLLSAKLRFDTLVIHDPEVEVRRDAAGVVWVAGRPMQAGGDGGGFGSWLLAQRQVIVRNATITWLDEQRMAPPLTLEKVDFRLDRDGSLHRFGLTGTPPGRLSSSVAARGEFSGRSLREPQTWKGRLYVEIGYADLALAQVWIPSPLPVHGGMGSLRLWLGFGGGKLGSATADLRLAGVQTQLAPDLPDIVLAQVQGRLRWSQSGSRTEASAEAFGFTTADGFTVAPTHVEFVREAPARGAARNELHIAGFDLAPVARLAAFVPFDEALRARLGRLQPAGTIEQADLSWQAGGGYAVQARFANLSVQADGALPGLRGLSGRVEANERGGTAALTVKSGGFELPKVFAEPVPLDFATVNAAWTVRDGRVELTLRSANFANEHLAGSVAGIWRSEDQGPGSVDLAGALVRAEARDVWRYVPVIAPATRAWLKRALVEGQSRDTRFRLKGPLRAFPFADGRSGLFEVVTHATGVTMDYAQGWPPVTGISGEVAFRGNRMEVRSPAAAILGLRVSDVQATIAELGKHDEIVRVKGVAQGTTADFLRYAAVTPAGEKISRFTSELKAAGQARLELALQLPLHRMRDSTVKGELLVQNNTVTLDPRVPPLENFGARIAFTERAFNVTDGRALMFGEPLSFEAADQADGGIVARVSGTLDVDAARAVWKHPALGYLDGQTRWRGSLGVRNRIATIVLDSTLVGLRSTLPAPFAKPAQTSQGLHVELRERPGRQGVLAVSLDKVATAQVQLDAAAPGGLSRGILALGVPATPPPGEGLWIRGNLDAVDVGIWRDVLSRSGDETPSPLAGIDLQMGTVDIGRRRLHDLKIKAERRDDAWQVTLAGREITGQASWASGGDGRMSARLSRLELPPAMTVIEAGGKPAAAEKRLPSVNLVADSFNFEGKELGRLTMVAQPEPAGWKLQQLELVNPDGKLVMDGRWITAEASRTDVNVRLDVSDLGKYLARLGWADAMQGGTATLDGPIAWSGNPTQLDAASLSGHLKLDAKNGRFRQIEPGMAKLLGILSLQALPRRATLDFRDVFSKGFSFDRISSDVTIAGGVAETRNFHMKGSSASVAMQGHVDLAHETQNLLVRVTPSLSEGIAIAGALVNPAIGVAALIAQKALKDPLSQMASFDYSVTGTWAEPVVERVSKPSASEKGR